ncbi:hypothetical protein FRC02_010985 [Tulasnella sp. 418]|nr:hypothetical protein FRC02_010985 [Tulasnella sp. 418]
MSYSGNIDSDDLRKSQPMSFNSSSSLSFPVPHRQATNESAPTPQGPNTNPSTSFSNQHAQEPPHIPYRSRSEHNQEGYLDYADMPPEYHPSEERSAHAPTGLEDNAVFHQMRGTEPLTLKISDGQQGAYDSTSITAMAPGSAISAVGHMSFQANGVLSSPHEFPRPWAPEAPVHPGEKTLIEDGFPKPDVPEWIPSNAQHTSGPNAEMPEPLILPRARGVWQHEEPQASASNVLNSVPSTPVLDMSNRDDIEFAEPRPVLKPDHVSSSSSSTSDEIPIRKDDDFHRKGCFVGCIIV